MLNLTIGMNWLVTMIDDITTKQLKNTIKVVKAMKKLGIKSMRIGTLEFSFADELARGPAFKRSSRQKIDAEKQRLQDLSDGANEDLSVMHVEDPKAFEDALIENELDDVATDVTDTELREGNIEETQLSGTD